MAFYTNSRLGSRFHTLKQSFVLDEGLPFADVLSEDDFEQAAERFGVAFASAEHQVYTPAVTLWAFLSQCLSGAKSCVAAVARVMVLRLALDLDPCSAHTGGYCKARAKLPEAFLAHLTYHVGQGLEQQAPPCWRWQGRRVLLADGTEVQAADTEANQEVYPQPESQKAGLWLFP